LLGTGGQTNILYFMKKRFILLTMLAMFFAIITVSCDKDNNSSNPPVNNDGGNNGGGGDNGSNFVIGQSYQGGKIAYIDNTGKHGLIAAPEDQSTGIQWYNGSYFLVDTETSIGTGKNNTSRIVQMQGEGSYAAKICYDLVLGGYDDWYLPSKDELNELYENRLEIGGFDYTGIYWSSSEGGPNDYGSYSNAWYQSFSNGTQYGNTKYTSKDYTYRVRAVRAF